MKKVIDIGLPDVGRLLEWIVLADGILYATLLPVCPDGSYETGPIEKQGVSPRSIWRSASVAQRRASSRRRKVSLT